MILYLKVENFMLIENAEIDFSEKLNIITCETGSGKSMLISSIDFVFGGKYQKNVIGANKDFASVTAILFCDEKNEKLLNTLNVLDIFVDDEYKLILHRSINESGKTISKINNKIVTLSTLKEVKELFLDVHSQHQHQLLLNKSKHIDLLDMFCGDELKIKKDELELSLKKYKDIVKEINKNLGNPLERERRLDVINFHMEEIEKLELYLGIDDELIKRRDFLQDIEKITKATKKAYELLVIGHNGDGLINLSNELESELIKISSHDEENKEIQLMTESFYTAFENFKDLKKSLQVYINSLNSEEGELKDIIDKLHSINLVSKKHGGSVENTLNYYNEIVKEKEFIENSEEKILLLEKEKSKYKQEVNKKCTEISKLRSDGKNKIIIEIEEILKSLGMVDVVFDVEIERLKEISNKGFDNVTFLITTNKGSKLEPLDKVASGGEMSRIMLALKSVLAKNYEIDSFIFDEIDTGVSGRTAQMVAEKLKVLSKSHQILCITHLPQIASMGDTHLCISKNSDNSVTRTNIKALNFDECVLELARLLGGLKITEQTKKASLEIKNFAIEFDKNIKN
ncbi:MAG: DNA repair protein RecN [Lachnospirales bacterium]